MSSLRKDDNELTLQLKIIFFPMYFFVNVDTQSIQHIISLIPYHLVLTLKDWREKEDIWPSPSMIKPPYHQKMKVVR